jgi:mannose-6-phosphate isomerase-like protein (cupin superfamily)
VGIVEAEPGKGPSLHTHATVEVFVPLTGRWTVYWGPDGMEQVQVGPWDVVSVVPGVFRGFRNDGSETAYLLGVGGGVNAGGNSYAPSVLAQLAAAGVDVPAAQPHQSS